MPLALILPRGDQSYLLRKPLIRRDMYVCMYVFIKLHITAQSGPVIYSFYATACNPPGGYLSYVCMCGCMYVCTFIKLHITAQSGPVIRVIRMYVCMYVCTFIKLHITAQSGPVIRFIRMYVYMYVSMYLCNICMYYVYYLLNCT